MCTQYVPTRAQRLEALWGRAPSRDDYPAEAFPGYLAPVLRRGELDSLHTPSVELALFGLIPPWSREGKDFRRCYNARSETVAEKPSFRHAWRQRQWCVIPADAFFEPCYDSGRPVRWRIESSDGAPLALAGLWEQWRTAQGDSVLSFSMLTLNADEHPVMNRFHAPGDEKRSVVLLEPAQVPLWLDADHQQARELIAPFDPARVHSYAAPKLSKPPRTSSPGSATRRKPDTPLPGSPTTGTLFD